MIKKYEYKVVKTGITIDIGTSNCELCTETCNRHGKLGWELVSSNRGWLTGQYTLFFKRELERTAG